MSNTWERVEGILGSENLNLLAQKKVGVVGLGSGGGFVALSLAMSGVQNLVLVDDDEVEEIWWVLAKVWGVVSFGISAGHEGLKDGKKDATVFGNSSFLVDGIGRNPNQSVFREGIKSVEGLISENISVG